ncbi:MAG: Oxidoreductase, short chain dehydrogenase/reductase family [Deinococcus sp.]|jgi:NAD(P)-dependent dehydrogenase (short-subunit alcohol dehydrogenase family)|nr:Oxidoreductase, short chain dehydrogenase/reductase family [Deinococcus sp.]
MTDSVNNQYEMRDPREQYPKPPFPEQPQSAPGLAQEMVPRPDHGETSYQGFGRLKGRKALITGADSGIGRAVAIAYAREGADVVLNYLPSEEADAQQVVALIEEAGQRAIAIPGDLKDEAFCQQLVEQAVEKLGGLDILVSNAGRQTFQTSIADITTAQFDETFKANVYALFWITKAAVPHMKPGSTIITTSSINARQPSETLLDYATTKAAIAAYTQALSGQLAEKGIRANTVAPGPFWTALQPSGGQSQEKVKEFGSDVPLGRPGQPAEIAPIYVLLASQESSFMTGGIYPVTGGELM